MTPVPIKNLIASLAVVAVGAFGGLAISGCGNDDVDKAQDQVDSVKSDVEQSTNDVQDQVDKAQGKADAAQDDINKELENAQDQVNSVQDDTQDGSGN